MTRIFYRVSQHLFYLVELVFRIGGIPDDLGRESKGCGEILFGYSDADRNVRFVAADVQAGLQPSHLVLKLSHIVLLASSHEQRRRETPSGCAASERNLVSEVEFENTRYKIAARLLFKQCELNPAYCCTFRTRLNCRRSWIDLFSGRDCGFSLVILQH